MSDNIRRRLKLKLKQKQAEAAFEPAIKEAGFLKDPTGAFAVKIKDERRFYAPTGTVAAASLPTDPEYRAKVYAKHYFPNMPVDEALKKMGSDRGRIFVIEGDDQYYVEPDTFFDSPIKHVATGFGPGIPLATSVVGEVAGALLGPGGAFGGAVVGGAAGDVVRQNIAEAMTGEPYDPLQTAEEAALSVGGEIFGRALGKLSKAFTNAEIKQFMADPDREQAARQLEALARDRGIQLTPAESTNLKSLKAQQRYLQDAPESADTMDEFYSRREEQISRHVEEEIEGISDVPPDSAKLAIRDAAQDIFADLRTARTDAVTPKFKAAFAEFPEPLPSTALMNQIARAQSKAIGPQAKEIDKVWDLLKPYVKRDDKGQFESIKIPAEDLHKIHEVISDQIDDLMGQETSSNAKRAVRDLTEIDQAITGRLKAMSTEYKSAMKKYATESEAIDKLGKGVLGALSKKSDVTIDTIAGSIFRATPSQIKSAREVFVSNGKVAEWDGMVAAYLSDAFDMASREMASGEPRSGAKFAKLIMGRPKDRARLKAAFGNDTAFVGFENLMKVLRASGRVPEGGSMTAFNQIVRDQISGMSSWADVATLPLRGIARVADTKDLSLGLNAVLKTQAERKATRKLAEVVTSPEGMAAMKELGKVSPLSKRFRFIAGQFIVRFFADDLPGLTDIPQAKPQSDAGVDTIKTLSDEALDSQIEGYLQQ